MKFNFSNRLLRSAEPEALGGNGTAPAAAATNIVPIAETPPAAESEAVPAAEAPVEPAGFLASVLGAVQSKGKLVIERDLALARAEKAETENLSLHSQISTLTTQLSTLQKERSEISAALTTAQAEKQEVDTAAASQVAALGFPAAELPAAGSSAVETRESLEAQLVNETDNNKRWELSAKLNAMN